MSSDLKCVSVSMSVCGHTSVGCEHGCAMVRANVSVCERACAGGGGQRKEARRRLHRPALL